MKPIVIIIESTRYQGANEIPVAIELGFDVVFVTSCLKTYPQNCLNCINQSMLIIEVDDINNTESILEKLKSSINIGMIHSCISISEMAYYEAARLSKLLSTNGMNYYAAEICRSKEKQRNLFKNALNFKSPNFEVINLDNFNSYNKLYDFPLILKPITLHGSIGIFILNNKDELLDAIKQLKTIYDTHHLITRDALLEKYISGQLISVETFTVNHKHTCLGVTDRIMGGINESVELGGSFPVNTGLNDLIYAAAYEILDKINLNSGMTHIEFIICDREIYLVEINGRMAGAFVPNMMSIAYDHDILKEYIRSLLLHESRLTLNNYPSKICTLRAVTSHIEGSLKKINWPDIINSVEPNLIKEVLKSGSPLRPPVDGNDRIAFFIITGTSEIESKKNAESYFQKIELEFY
ncbi:MAG: ATP-grasp domain-containing protein [Gammaproteobacteria bacterium]